VSEWDELPQAIEPPVRKGAIRVLANSFTILGEISCASKIAFFSHFFDGPSGEFSHQKIKD
jgi:hypothetical protein